jgi:hypothetical protein
MSRAFTPKVVTANALLEGDAIWLTADDQWTRDMAGAELITDENRAAAQLAVASAQINDVVGVYLADAVTGDAGPTPTHFRETFRTRGPSNYAHGKQVEL